LCFLHREPLILMKHVVESSISAREPFSVGFLRGNRGQAARPLACAWAIERHTGLKCSESFRGSETALILNGPVSPSPCENCSEEVNLGPLFASFQCTFDRDLIRGGHCGQRSCEPH
jgi:hypothetical protein